MNIERRLATLLEDAGACVWGATPSHPVPDDEWSRFEKWLEKGFHAEMDYMTRHKEIRRDPALLLVGAKTIISTAFNYRQPNPIKGMATYALGRDYHKVIRRRLKKVVNELKNEYGGQWRICLDSAPILERYWAVECGLGYRSSGHGNVVVPGMGSMVFLAEILTTLTLESQSHTKDRLCDKERVDTAAPACPTGALQAGGSVDARRCINYLTIEHRGEWSENQKAIMALPGANHAIFGCDICQLNCQYNSLSPSEIIPELKLNPELPRFLDSLRAGQPAEIPDSPLKRAGVENLLRNLRKKTSNSL